MGLSTRVLIARATAMTRRTARERRTQLEQELGGYQSESDLRDFEAMLDRYPDGMTCEIREILAAQAQVREQRRRQQQWPAMKGYRQR
jgi:hypothetical protein